VNSFDRQKNFFYLHNRHGDHRDLLDLESEVAKFTYSDKNNGCWWVVDKQVILPE